MKKHLLLIFSVISFTTFGQVIPKGTRFIGGDLNINYTENKSNSTTFNNSFQVGIAPAYTKFTKDNASVTFVLAYQISSYRSKSGFNSSLDKSAAHTILAGVFFRNYKMLSEKFGVSIQYGGSIGTSFTNNIPDSDRLRSVSLNLSAGPGVIYLLNEKFALEGTSSLINFGTNYTWYDSQSSYSIGTGVNASPSLGLGFRYFLK